MIIGVDFDDVLVNSSETFAAFWNAVHGTSFKKEHFTHHEFHRNWGATPEDVAKMWMRFSKAESHKFTPAAAGAKSMVARLAQFHKLHVVTNRPLETDKETYQLIDVHFPGIFSDIHFCTKNGGTTRAQLKSDVCRKIGSGIMLEDHPHGAQQCAADGIHIYLFDQPWNQGAFPLLPGTIVRVSSWQDKILETLLP
ncbi:MAG: hypothetical protein A3F47_02435 [Candidatus Staskawiczbacteria bacterium RIFCSPHIGHO2_12_FULL_38_11]|uniref:Nucleotidase n=1 Tax=Candidatus Staskawiczbacteria bacterium RIFCSPHIGHO2_12_FULL_38_11 TaxID=1802209 RepID=A0A1G2I4K2_9BACT|nr:MAG: hypothetical protein A3F47_02435 [Candidatus Staskawiczbacteria bacterium RIFCSPHIGHO2_12_FULL_38_11]